jgi:hypothetical protein
MRTFTLKGLFVTAIFMLLGCLAIHAADGDLITKQITIKLEEAGTLPSKIGDTKKYKITNHPRLAAKKTESVGSPCCSSHVLRPSHCPTQLNEQRRSPRRYEYTYPYTSIRHIALHNMPYQ